MILKTKNSISMLLCLFIGVLLFSSCEADKVDNRAFEGAKIVALKLDGTLYTTTIDGSNEVKVVLKPGVPLTAIKTEILVSNGSLTDFENNVTHDFTKPVNVTVKGEDGNVTKWKLIVQSPPKLNYLEVVGMTIPQEKVHFGNTTIIVEIPVDTNVSNLAVNYTWLNGTMTNYTNGSTKDYTISLPNKPPFKMEVLGADGVTKYYYDVIFTSDPVGPATIQSMVINDILTTQMVVVDATKNIVQPVLPSLTNLSTATVQINPGFGCIIDPAFTGTGINMLQGFKVKITGTNGVETEFTVKNALIDPTLVFARTQAQLQLAADAGSSAAFSNGSVLVTSHSMATGASLTYGINAYDLSGNYVNALSKTGTNFDNGAVTGIRKVATDSNGKILGVQLGAGAATTTALKIFKWNSKDDTAPQAYINYTGTSLGLTYGPRAAGINISGSLDGDAVITVGMAQKTDVIVWTVTGGVLNPTPTIKSYNYTGTGYYYSIEPNDTGFVGIASGTNFNGINFLNSSMVEGAKVNGIPTSDGRVFTYKGRKYLATVIIPGDNKAIFRMFDITDSSQSSLDNPIMNIISTTVATNANRTVDADFAIINGKLHVVFLATNDKLAVYNLGF
ncbi:hypothetical protein [Flavobacterium quisquiliarum]|uniref:DUF5018 domain-containing protein n=1 Tax=Flavobacterium quisquiliarum TaxID=1834436 RepID=A0ABV8W7S9_9FLAO|nr:hypothetical protein [Flavobacterium quisquiliarum]MBW1654108.1 hypothetical protein [Flavobacterium quisquiliarum]